MSSINQDNAQIPWFRQRWLWFLLSIPICSVILSSMMVFVAVVGQDTMVSDNYYKDGMAINRTIEKDLRADALALHPLISIEGSSITLKFDPKNTSQTKQAFLRLKLHHPTIEQQDADIKLLPTQGLIYTGELPFPMIGRRYLDLYAFDNSWRIREEITLPLKNHMLNKPSLSSN